MTVLKRDVEPKGTYVEGYDVGLRDATIGKERTYRRPTGRQRNASFYRHGYADGYEDGLARLRK